MREIILGTAGHVDHGKTSLVRALTGIDTDRLKEEKQRGITIELGFAFLDLPCGHRLGIVDVPGHEKFVKNMVAGAAGMDLVAFIVAADEGIMPQTREHFEICRLLGLQRGLIVITKKDMVEPDWLELVEEEVREFFAGSFLAEAPLVTVSSTTGAGLDRVKEILDQLVRESEFSEAHGPFRMPVDRVFTMKGFGAVVTGTSISGRIRVGDEATVYPGKLTARVRGIQIHSAGVEEVEAGHRTAINLQGVEKEMIQRGNVLATPGCLQPSYLLDGDFLYISANPKSLKNRSRVRVHIGTAEIMGRIVLLDGDELEPGTEANVQLLLEEPVTAWPGDHYVVRSYSPVTTIGGGMVLNGSPKKRRRVQEHDRRHNREVFDIYRTGTPEELALLHIRESGYNGLPFDRLAIKTGIFGNRLKKILQKPLSTRQILVVESEKQRMVEATVYEGLKAKALESLERFHADNPLKPGLAKEELRARLHRGLDQKLFQFLLNDLLKSGRMEQDQAVIRLAGHRVALKEDENRLRLELEKLYRDAGLAVPTLKEALARFDSAPPNLVREVFDMLEQQGVLARINADLYCHVEVLAELKHAILAYFTEQSELDAPAFKTLTGVSRKFAIPLLEYFDRVKVTMRVGDKRILRERR